MSKKKKNYKYLFIKPNDKVVVRFIGPGIMLYQCFPISHSNGGTTVNKPFFRERDSEFTDCHSGKKYISFVIDRADNQIKIFPCPIRVYNTIRELDKNADILIKRRGLGLKTKYSAEVYDNVSEDTDPNLISMVENTLEKYSFVDILVHNKKWEFVKEKESVVNRFDILDL